ncbi:MAG: hypothetical protein JST93_33980 [Acidobacteria bacterium]|nr:hypothetical protein [Acidobacteriota bacterium]
MSIQIGEIPDPKPLPPPPVKWTPIEFWVSGEMGNLVFANILKAGVMMRLKAKPQYCWFWPFRMTMWGKSGGWTPPSPGTVWA